MPTLGSILNTARSALTAYQSAVAVTSHNIANGRTEGYSRQRAVLAPMPPLHTAVGSFGGGVEVTNVIRYRDALLDSGYRREAARLGGYELRERTLGGIESIFAEPGDAGLAAAMDAFFLAYADLSNDPTSSAARAALRDRGRNVASRLNGLAVGLTRTGDGLRRELPVLVDRVNDLGAQAADLNRQIVAAEADGTQAPTLRDARDRVLDEMAGLVSIHVIEQAAGDVAVYLGGAAIVDGSRSRDLEVKTLGGVSGVGLTSGASALAGIGGPLEAQLELINDDIPSLMGRLDALAGAFVSRVNQLHRGGTNPLGQTGIDFFDPAGVTAATVGLSVDVEAGARAIAAGSGNASGQYQPGANDVALAIAGLRDEQNGSLGQTFGEFHRELVTDLGLALAAARDGASAHRTLADRALTRREAVSGVLTDEELISLIELQGAFAAATRVVTAADEMVQTVLSMV